MGIFDDIVGTTTPQKNTSGGLFDDIIGSNPNVEPNSAFGIFQSQGVRDYMRELQKQSVRQEELNKDHSFAGITSVPKEIWKGIKTGLENTPWNAPVKTERDFNKPLGTVVGPAWENTKDKWRTLDDRLNARLQPLTDKWLNPDTQMGSHWYSMPSGAEVINALSGAGAEIVDSTFAPITGALEGASKTPGLSFASNIIRKFFGAVGGGGGEIVSEITDLVPFISPETRAQLEEPIQFWGGFVGQLAGGYGVGKAVGKATPTILETKMKLANTVDIIMRDKLIQNKIAELNAKMRGYEGDYREGEAIDWGNTKSPGAEDVIDWGDNDIPAGLSKKTNQFVPDSELPIIDAETGTLRPKPVEKPVEKTPGVVEEQAPKKVPYSAVKAERENYIGKDVQVTTDGVDGPAVVVSTPSKKEVVVRLADGTEITVPTSAVRDVRTNAEIIAAAESRATQPTQIVQTQVPSEQGAQTADTSISVKPAPPVSTAKTAKEMKGGEPTKSAEPQATRNDLVTVNGKTYQLSGDTLVKYQQAKQAYDASIARLNAEYARAKAGRREDIAKELKALGMQWSATLRETTGNFTAKELAKQVKTEGTNYKGKKVIVEVNGKKVEGEVIGTAYGKIKVRLKDGAEVTVTKDKVTDPRTKEDIKAGVLKREGVTEYDPSQPVGIQRGNGEVIKITDKQTGKSEELIVISKKPDGSLVTTRKDVYFPRKTTPEKFDIEYLDRTEPLPSGGVTFGELEAMDRANEAAAKKQTQKEEEKSTSKEAFGFQNVNQEKIVHTIGQPVQVDLMNGGDMFRALTELGEGKDFAKSYFIEKYEKVGRFIDKAIEGRVHPDDTISNFKIKDPKKFDEYLKKWKEQPTSTISEQLAKDINIKMLEGDYVGAKKLHTQLLDKLEKEVPKEEVPKEEVPINRDFEDQNVEMVRTEDLVPYREFDRAKVPNWREEKINELREDIRKNGIKEPLILSYGATKGNTILGEGNTRLMIAQELGIPEVPVTVIRSTDLVKASEKAAEPVKAPKKVEPNEYGYVPGNMKPSDIGIPTAKETVSEQVSVEQVKPKALKEEEQLGSDEYNQILIELDLAEAGKRGAYVYQDKYGSIEKITSKQSTFPEWMPEGTRLRSVIDRYMKGRDGTVNDVNIKYKEGSVLDRLDKAVREKEQERIEINRLQREAESVQPKEDTSIAQEEYAKAFPDMMGGDTTQGGGGPMKPISGSGELRTPTATQRILSENLQAEFGELPQYSRVNWDEQARLVQDFISRDPTASRNVAMGREHAPAGILDTAVWKEYRLRARANGDVAASIQLAKSTIPEALSRFGQETGVLSTLDKSDLTGIIIDASKQYVKNWEKRNPGKSGEAEITKAVEQVRNSMKKNASSREVYKEIARRLLCK